MCSIPNVSIPTFRNLLDFQRIYTLSYVSSDHPSDSEHILRQPIIKKWMASLFQMAPTCHYRRTEILQCSNGGYILDTEQYISTTYLPLEREE